MARASVALACLTMLLAAGALRDVPGVAPVGHTLRPIGDTLGLEQNWRIFAPEPRRAALRFEAVVEWSDGRRTTWTPHSGSRLTGAYRDYRWRKWMENAANDDEGPRLWPAAARYILQTLPPRRGAAPVRLRLIRYVKEARDPGEPTRHGWQAVEVYRARLAA